MNTVTKPAAAKTGRALRPIDEVRQGLSKMADDLDMALPSHISIDRFRRIAITAVQQNPALLKADRKSLFGACMTAAQLGLVTDGVLGQAYLVPFKGKVQLIPGYKGLLTLVRQSGEISSIDVDTIHDKDEVEYVTGDDSRLTIRPNWTNRGAIIGAYAIARFKDGGLQRALMTLEEIEAIRKASPSANSPAWKNHYGEMAKKTAFRRLCKMLPLSTEAQSAAALADEADAGRIATVDREMVVVSEPIAEKSSADEAAPPKRRRGRPPKAKTVQPDAAASETIEGEAHEVNDLDAGMPDHLRRTSQSKTDVQPAPDPGAASDAGDDAEPDAEPDDGEFF